MEIKITTLFLYKRYFFFFQFIFFFVDPIKKILPNMCTHQNKTLIHLGCPFGSFQCIKNKMFEIYANSKVFLRNSNNYKSPGTLYILYKNLNLF